MIEISDPIDHDLVANEDAGDSVDEGSDGTDEDTD